MEVMEFFLKGQLSSWIIQPIFNTPFQVALIKKIIKFKFIALISIFDIQLQDYVVNCIVFDIDSKLHIQNNKICIKFRVN